MKVLLIGPFETKGRYKGGIAYIVNQLFQNKDLFSENGLDIEKFDTCRVERKMTDQGKMSIGNIKNTFILLRSLGNTVMNSKPDVIYYNTSFGIPLLKDLLVLKLSGSKKHSKVVVHIHFAEADKILPSNKILAKLAFSLLKKEVNHVVFLSKETRDSFVRKGIKESNTSVIYNFHSIKMEKEEVEKKIEELPIKTKREILFIGSIDERKGILDLLKALKKVTIPYHLSICGEPVDSEIKKKLEKALSEFPLGVAELKGFVSGELKNQILKNTDILILPSYGEGLPIVLLEGLAAACAIISTNVGAIPEIFNENNGYIIKSGDINELSNAINSLSDENKIATIIKHNYEISEEYNLSSFVNQMTKVCLRV